MKSGLLVVFFFFQESLSKEVENSTIIILCLVRMMYVCMHTHVIELEPATRSSLFHHYFSSSLSYSNQFTTCAVFIPRAMDRSRYSQQPYNVIIIHLCIMLTVSISKQHRTCYVTENRQVMAIVLTFAGQTSLQCHRYTSTEQPVLVGVLTRKWIAC